MPLVQTTPYNISPLGGWDSPLSSAVYLGFTRYNTCGCPNSMSQALGGHIVDGGTKVFWADNNGDRIWVAPLLTPYDGSSLSMVGVWDLAMGGIDNGAFGIRVKPDGSRFFVAGTQNDSIYQFDTATDFSAVGATHTGTRTAQDGENVRNLDVRPDGKKMWIIDSAAISIHEYDLSTAWDISTAAFTGKSAIPGATHSSFNGGRFRPDGTMFYGLSGGNKRLYKYLLSTPWDIDTLSYSGEQLILGTGSGETANDVDWNPDGTRMEIFSNAGFRSYSVPLP